jgi:hypothetical protein
MPYPVGQSASLTVIRKDQVSLQTAVHNTPCQHAGLRILSSALTKSVLLDSLSGEKEG